MAISTGITLLTTGEIRIYDRLVDFWEFVGGSTNSSKGSTSGSTSHSVSVLGVDSFANGALKADSTGNINLTGITSSTAGFTLVAFIKKSGGVGWPILWGDAGNSTSTSGIRAGYDIDNNRLYKKDNTNAATIFTLPSVTLSSAQNGYSFLCFTFSTVAYPSQKMEVYDGSGNLLMSSTQNFGVLDASINVFTNDWVGNAIGDRVLDKVILLNGRLSPQQILYLYNAGFGRDYIDIQGHEG